MEIDLVGGTSGDIFLNEPITIVQALPVTRQEDSFTFDLDSILGVYEPRTELVTVLGLDGSIIYQTEQVVQGIQGVDFTYIIGACIFINVLRSFFGIFREVIRSL